MGETSWSHDNKEWQITLDLARDLGWPEPTRTKDHPALIVECAGKSPRCKFRIYGTGQGTESVAISTRRKVRNCPHRDLNKPLVAIRSALDGAELLLDSSEKLLDWDDAQRSEQEVLVAVENLDIAGERLAEVEAWFADVAEELTRSSALVEATVPDDHAAREVQELADEAGSRLRIAKLTLREQIPKGSTDGELLRARHAELTERLDRIRGRLRGR